MTTIPYILYNNILKDYTLLYSGSEIEGFELAHIYDWHDFTMFRAESGSSITVSVTSDTIINSIGWMVREFTYAGSPWNINLYHNAALVETIDLTSDQSTGLKIFDNIDLSSGDTLTIEFDISTEHSLDVKLIAIGDYYKIDLGQHNGVQPPTLDQFHEINNSVAVYGSHLGRDSVVREAVTTLSFDILTQDEVRNYWEPFQRHAAVFPFFYAWNLADRPDEVVLAGADDIDAPTNVSPGRMTVLMPLRCIPRQPELITLTAVPPASSSSSDSNSSESSNSTDSSDSTEWLTKIGVTADQDKVYSAVIFPADSHFNTITPYTIEFLLAVDGDAAYNEQVIGGIRTNKNSYTEDQFLNVLYEPSGYPNQLKVTIKQLSGSSIVEFVNLWTSVDEDLLENNGFNRISIVCGINDCKLYVNGQLEDEDTTTAISPSPPNRVFALLNRVRYPPSDYWDHGQTGLKISDLRIWNGIRSQSDINTYKWSDKTVIGGMANLRGYWPMDEGSGTTISPYSPSHGGTAYMALDDTNYGYADDYLPNDDNDGPCDWTTDQLNA